MSEQRSALLIVTLRLKLRPRVCAGAVTARAARAAADQNVFFIGRLLTAWIDAPGSGRLVDFYRDVFLVAVARGADRGDCVRRRPLRRRDRAVRVGRRGRDPRLDPDRGGVLDFVADAYRRAGLHVERA